MKLDPSFYLSEIDKRGKQKQLNRGRLDCEALQNALKRCSSGTALRGVTFKELDKRFEFGGREMSVAEKQMHPVGLIFPVCKRNTTTGEVMQGKACATGKKVIGIHLGGTEMPF